MLIYIRANKDTLELVHVDVYDDIEYSVRWDNFGEYSFYYEHQLKLDKEVMRDKKIEELLC